MNEPTTVPCMLAEDTRHLELHTGKAEIQAILLVVQTQNAIGSCGVSSGACMSSRYTTSGEAWI